MLTEMNLVRNTSPRIELKHPFAVVAARKKFNEAANSLVHDAVLKNDLGVLAEKSAALMVVVARILVGTALEPDLENFVYACSELISGVRADFDTALRFGKEDDIKLTAVMMEVILKGVAATLALPLGALMEEVLEAEAAERAPDIQAVLTKFREGA
jgi:hypothetical protein